MASQATTANIQDKDQAEPPSAQTLNSSAQYSPLAREHVPAQPNLLSAPPQITPAFPSDPPANQDKLAEGGVAQSPNVQSFRSPVSARSGRGRGMQAPTRLGNIYLRMQGEVVAGGVDVANQVELH